MRRRWAVRIAVSVATGTVATVLLLSLEATLAPAGATASLAGAGAAGAVVAIALLPATTRYPRGLLPRARRVAIGTVFGVGTVGFAGYAGLDVLPGPQALLATGCVLVAVLPVAYDRGWRTVAESRTLVAGDDASSVRREGAVIDPSPVGYCAPTARRRQPGDPLPTGDRSVSARSDLPSGAARSSSAPAAPPEPTAQRNGGTEGPTERGSTGAERGSTRTERGSIQQPDGGSVGLSPGDHGPDEPGDRPTASDSPALPTPGDADPGVGSARPSGSTNLDRLGGLSDLDRVVRARGVDAVVLRFATADRGEFFGALRVCDAAGVDAFVPRSRTEAIVLADEHRSLAGIEREPAARDSSGRNRKSDGPTLVPVALEILPWHARLAKRGFDLAFATVGIVALSPLMTAIAIAIRLDSPGPVLYGQWRTGRLGEPFQLLKFRSMVSDAEAASGPRLSDEDAGGVDPRVTRVGRVLRATHLDELPQLFSILVGEMSVVGPRPERPALDAEIAADGVGWRQRWFLTPGLTGLAQINDVTGFQPREKLAHDLEYARRQSLALDVRIVAIQLGQVARDVLELLARRVR